MAVVGEAHIVVRALTDRVAGDIKNGFDGVDGNSASKAGKTIAEKFQQGLNKNIDANIFTRLADAMGEVNPRALEVRDAINGVIMQGYKMQAVIPLVIGSIGTLIGGLVSVVGAAGAAAVSFTAVIGVFMAFKIASSLAGMALGDVGKAVSAAIQQSQTAAKTMAALRKELKQLKFDAEAAALAVEGAALNLEKAIQNLNMTADLPPNSMARRQAVLAYKEADLAYRRAQERAKDLAKQAAKGIKGLAALRGNDPYKGLTKSQKDFAKYLVTLFPLLKKLKEAVASGFLPVLQKQMERLIKVGFTPLENGFKKIGTALGVVTQAIGDALSDPTTIANISQMFTDMAFVIGEVGKALGQLIQAFTTLMADSGPIIQALGTFILDLATKFNNWIQGMSKDKKLKYYFLTAASMATNFGKIFGGIFDGLIAIIEANFSPGTGGWRIIDWLGQAAQGFGDISKDQAGLRKFFNAIADNFMAMFSGLGGLIGQLVLLGTDPNIGKFWTIIKDSAPAFGEMISKGMPLLPILGEIFNNIIGILNAFSDTESPKVFLEMIRDALGVVKDLAKSDLVKWFLSMSGPIHAWVLGFTQIKSAAQTALDYVMGTIQKGLGTVGDFFGNIQKIRDGFKDIADSKFGGWIGNVVDRFKQFEFPKDFKEILREIPRMVFPEDLFGDLTLIEGLDFSKLKEAFDIGKFDGFKTGVSKMLTELDGQFANMGKSVKTAFAEMGKSTNPLVMAIGRLGTLIMANPIIAAIAAIVAIMVILYNTSDEFRKFVDDALKRVMGYLTRAWEQLQEAFQPVIDAWNRLMAAFGVGQGGSNPLVMFFEALVKILEVLLSVLIPIITTIVTMFIPQITFLIDLVASWVKIFRGLYDIVTAFFTALFTWNWDKFGEVAGKAFKDIGNAALGLFNGIANFFVDMINNIIKGINDISTNIKDASGGTINFGKIPTLPHVNLHLAKGGVVMPSPGGSLVNVAEAGKPEKVVPLDSEGLSAGDRKVLDALNSRSGINIAINGADMDKNELAAEVSRRLAFQMRKGAI